MPNRGRGRGRGRGGRGRGRGRGRNQRNSSPARPTDEWSVQAVGAAETAAKGQEKEVEVSLEKLFTSDSNFDSHYAAQETNANRYLATLLVLQKNGTEIAQAAKVRALAATWARKDHKLAKRLLAQSEQFGLVEVLKALTLLDAGRKIREWEKRMKRLQMQPKVKPKKIGQIKSNVDNLTVIKPKKGTVSGALSRHIRQWVRQIPASQLEFYALHYPREPWKRLADLVHLNPKKDFPTIPWFLPFCFGEAAPDTTMASKCALVNAENVNELVSTYEVPYAHIKEHSSKLTIASKKRIAQYEAKVDTVLWYYEELVCPEVDEVITERMTSGEKIGLPYGKIMERLLMLKMKNCKKPFVKMLVDLAQQMLAKLSVSLEAPVVVIGDRSSSMSVAVRTATIIASVLCAISKATLCFFNDTNYEPPTMPRDIEQVLDMAETISACGCTSPAASLWPYYEKKQVVKTFIMVTDEEENTNCHTYRFAPLFKKYHDEVYPARLVFVSFLSSQHSNAPMQAELKNQGFTPLQFRLDQHRPDLCKLDNLLGLLAKEAVIDFKDEVDNMEAEIIADNLAEGVAAVQIPK